MAPRALELLRGKSRKALRDGSESIAVLKEALFYQAVFLAVV